LKLILIHKVSSQIDAPHLDTSQLDAIFYFGTLYSNIPNITVVLIAKHEIIVNINHWE